MSAYQAIRATLAPKDTDAIRRALHEAQASKYLTQLRGNDGQMVVALTTIIMAVKDELHARGVLDIDREGFEVNHAAA